MTKERERENRYNCMQSYLCTLFDCNAKELEYLFDPDSPMDVSYFVGQYISSYARMPKWYEVIEDAFQFFCEENGIDAWRDADVMFYDGDDPTISVVSMYLDKDIDPKTITEMEKIFRVKANLY